MIISIGNSRKDIKWRNVEISWEQFIDKVKNTHRTAETMMEYNRMSKAAKDDIKDVGGFVGGKLKDGIRRNSSLEFRSVITLDADYAEEDFWTSIKERFNFKCCIYSTHKHKSNAPRLRLIIPLSRNVNADEYTAAARLIAYDIGIDQFDDSTYEPARLMYWPSTSRDGEFIFESQDGEVLNPDIVLSRYKDYRDTSEWPVSSRQANIIEKNISKQADPLKKDGIVGAFCRTYSIEEAIEKFLSHIYKPSLIKGRYDYIEADSSAGLVIYENKFAYSHHATDKAANTLCNAFDLVRIHMFSELDVDSKEETRTSRLPSFKAMSNFCTEDENVKLHLINQTIEEAKSEFNIENDDWKKILEIKKNGAIKDSLNNIVKIIRNDKALSAIAYNLHKDCVDVKGELPWAQIKPNWNDSDMASLKVYFDAHYKIWAPTKLKEALICVAVERAYHPVREYLNGLEQWDGIKRLENILIEYLGAADNEYTRAVTRKTLVAAVARVFEPGIKFDSILILNGPQGIGKGTLIEKLGKEWFSDSLSIDDMKDKTAAEKLQGQWILELAELAGIRKTDIETVKSFITRKDDKYRASYGINVESHPRQSIIIGTTNNENGFLRDVTGNRRFWPVKLDPSNTEKRGWDLKEIDKIWAEALYLYKEGEELFLRGDIAQMAMIEQNKALESDDREGLVREYLETPIPKNWSKMTLYERRNYLSGSDFGANNSEKEKRKTVCTMEIWCECFGKDASALRKSDSYEISSIMAKIEGWKPYNKNKTGMLRFSIYNRQRAFMRCEQGNEHDEELEQAV